MTETPRPASRTRRLLMYGCLGIAGLSVACIILAVLVAPPQASIAEVVPAPPQATASPAPTAAVVTAAPEQAAPPEPTATAAPTDAPEPTAIPEPTLDPTPVPEPIILEGQGATVTDPREIPGGVYRINLSHAGEQNFIVRSFAPGGDESGVTNVIGDYQGQELLVSEGGEWMFEVDADGAWSLTIEPINRDDSAAGRIEGSGDIVSGLFMPTNEGPVPYTFRHDGERNFIVRLVCAGGSDTTQNEIGAVDASAMARFETGPCLWDINADGAWSIRPR